MGELRQKIGKYYILEKIVVSNYAEVYMVADTKDNNYILKLARTKDPANNDLIAREYSILSQIKHPNIVDVYDFDKHGERA